MRARLLAAGAALSWLLVYIWMRDVSWRAVNPDAPALLAVFPAVYWLGRPWSAGSEPALQNQATAAAAVLIGAGVILQVTLALALGWCCLLRAALAWTGVHTAHPRPTALLALAAAGFPWLATDLGGLAWHLRTSAAATLAVAFSALGFDAAAHGPLLDVGGSRLFIDSACSGMGALQALVLLAAVLQALPDSRPRSPIGLLAIACALAYAANLARLAGAAMLAVTRGPAAARGPAHQWLGLLAIVVPALLLARFAAARGAFRHTVAAQHTLRQHTKTDGW